VARTFGEVIGALSKAEVPVKELPGRGCAAVTPSGGRLVAFGFQRDAPNLLWSNPEISNTQLLRDHPDDLVGGLGGDRVWFGPEIDYHWNGRPDWERFSNYHVPSEVDPGAYVFANSGGDDVVLRGTISLRNPRIAQNVDVLVRRAIRMTAPPIPDSDPMMRAVEYVGVEMSHQLEFAATTSAGRIDMWHLLQIPVGAVLLVPLRRDASAPQRAPLSYGRPGGWVEGRQSVRWKYVGDARAKFGLSSDAVTGRAAVIQRHDKGYWSLIVREFPVNERAKYGDHPYDMPRVDQVFQAWDGFGFGEMEYHSPILDAKCGPRRLEESDRLWAFGGAPDVVLQLAQRLLDVDLERRAVTSLVEPQYDSFTQNDK
jgi:hypothetical protein